MNFCEPFVRRPVMTVLVMAGILIFGLAGYRLLPVSTLPNVDFPTIQVTGELPGASPETMASAVATVLERQFSTIAGIDEMTSISGQGTSRVTIQFALDRDIDAAAQDVNSAIASAAGLAICTRVFGPRRSWPRVTTRSPLRRPDAMMAWSPSARATMTLRTSATESSPIT